MISDYHLRFFEILERNCCDSWTHGGGERGGDEASADELKTALNISLIFGISHFYSAGQEKEEEKEEEKEAEKEEEKDTGGLEYSLS